MIVALGKRSGCKGKGEKKDFVINYICFSCFFNQKRFVKGFKQIGKNFYRIREEFFPNKKVVRNIRVRIDFEGDSL